MTQPPLTLPTLLQRSVAEFGESVYLVTPTDRLTYIEAEERSARLARWLLHEGVGKGSRVGLFFANGAEWVTWWLAVSRIGAVAVPLSTMYAPAEIAKVLRLADIGLLIAPSTVLNINVAERLEAALPELAGQSTSRLALRAAPYLRRIAVIGGVDRPWASPGYEDATVKVPAEVLAAAEAEVSPADLAIMVHTSGSTADPKGVLHTHGTLVRQTSTWPSAIRVITRSEDQSRILCAMPFFWIGGLLAVTGALHEPVTVAAMPNLDPATALDLAERERITGIVGWPAFTQRLREHPSFADRDLSSAPMLRDGPLDIAMTDVPDGFPVHRTMSETAGGFVFTDMAIVDENGTPVAPGDTGELLVRGIGVMAGYNKRERSETFDVDGWYHTGDKVYRRDGDPRLFYVGRTTDLIKAAGANVSPLEVEAVIAESADVAQCVVVGIDDPQRGEEVCAIVVPTAAIDAAALASYTRDQLSAYKVPTLWVLTTSEKIPTLPSGKFDRKTLRQLVIDGDLESVRIQQARRSAD
ncbi:MULTISPECIES: class I adenylate-forming enzyme family protein [unclassified Mycolicibacterium]|uniref:class I adenylate-forming enzyme family protein n=1 Tax=unclassified Mycolicibacterium TaxID=2636767 RepID=UPI001305F841|nr:MULTISPECIES: class I adenylate-forming enzyme family protein [unclassified Mycolicibacterium]MUL85582.1 acyl--CoA ligase [Mycolicibacterium sp. CBMA 329]MUL88654.1 acyl--CoA ligase [Mycolicibacterium sp. CBMA 331]MUM02051.1 acyl--CoA ligase [Mycolicibacterium sp. CBMA 334]MUM26952.1 acyl--CoA ligase [Mycolicibacterium sp. CBMA 295]MUM40301.1 acyl--CoA ligase [Mycolicibacterium sp. CBMA 247]